VKIRRQPISFCVLFCFRVSVFVIALHRLDVVDLL
jgi:hypothetical protein